LEKGENEKRIWEKGEGGKEDVEKGKN